MSIDTPMPTQPVELMGLVPPHNIEAEQSVLGALMLDNNRFDDIVEILSVDAFYLLAHRRVFAAMHTLAQDNLPLDVVTLSEHLEQDHQLASIGGLAFLAELARNTPSAANVVAYAGIVREHELRRQLVKMGSALNQSAAEGKQSSKSLIEASERRLFDLAEDRQQKAFDLSTAISGAVDTIDRAFNAKDGITGTPTGFKDLDELTGGLQSSDLIVIAGRPSMGKTALGLNLVENALTLTEGRTDKATAPAFVFSLEMPEDQLMLRMLASQGRLNLRGLRTGRLEDHEWDKLTLATTRCCHSRTVW